MGEPDPTELVSCGKCGAVNSVPYGLEKFKCYKCGIAVAIARDQTAACAAASPQALYYEGPSSWPAQESSSSSAGASSQRETKKTEASGGGFFGKLQSHMDKALQKVEQAFIMESPPGGGVDKPEMPTGTPGTEEGAVQWALSQSSKSQQGSRGSSKAPSGLQPGRQFEADRDEGYPSASSGLSAGATARLKAAEDRAARAEQLVNSAMQREALSAKERVSLREQLDEAEELVKGLTQQLDGLQLELQQERRRCKALENELQQVRAKEISYTDSPTQRENQKGNMSQLTARINELEAAVSLEKAALLD